jgi:ribosomal protein S18 acetylase RimI-like enzyme
VNFLTAIRPAVRQDAVQLAALLDIASRGLVLWLWGTVTAPGQSAIEVGRARILELKEFPSHFSNWTVITIENEIAGAFAGYPISNSQPAKDGADLPSLYQPMLELESCAVGSWYIMTLSVFPEFRNHRLGTMMLARAAEIARDAGLGKLSIMLVSDNISALRLYHRQGFREIGRRKFIPFPGSRDEGDWLLLTKEV